MRKRIDFNEAKDLRRDGEIEKTLNAEFKVPKVVNAAKEEAFAQIREKAAQQQNTVKKQPKRRSKIRVVYDTVVGTAAVAAVFSVICIANPAFASDIPVVGSVFERIGKSLGFSGDYTGYAKPLVDETERSENVQDDVVADGNVSEGVDIENTDSGEKAAENTVYETGSSTDTAYSKTVDGVTVTLSETYCNEEALYLSMLIKSEEPLPETEVNANQQDKPIILLDAEMTPDFNPDFNFLNGYIDGKMLDENTYAGVLRVEMRDLSVNHAGWSEYYEKRNAFLKEKGFDVESPDFGKEEMEAMEAAFGMEDFSDAGLVEFGGPDMDEYTKPLTVPESFSMDLNIHQIVGVLPEELRTKPEMPQELIDEYNQAMADAGLDNDNYENFTEEEKELERRFRNDQWNKYADLYPDVRNAFNQYENWMLKGDWNFNINVEQDHTNTVTKEINLLDDEGNGVLSVTKTPFEIKLHLQDPECRYAATATDADGDMLPFGGSGDANTFAIQDRDVSKIYVYLCDYYEYMDELKGYYWSPDYEEKKKTKNFKQYLDEKGIPCAEVSFE